MSDDSINAANRSASGPEKELRSLPVLPLIRQTYCPQNIVDYAIRYIGVQDPALLIEFADAEKQRGDFTEYSDVCHGIRDFLLWHASEHAAIPLPHTNLGMLDLVCELSRRTRQAYGLPEIQVRGKPLSEGPYKSFPPLIEMKIHKWAQRPDGVNLTQEFADAVLPFSYQRRPDLWFETAEEYRHETFVGGADDFRYMLYRMVEDRLAPSAVHFSDPTVNHITSHLYIEGARRIYRMCEIDDPSDR